jgi:hypothetical protein
MAQDFHALFGVGDDDVHIGTTDAQGVALAAIQGDLPSVFRAPTSGPHAACLLSDSCFNHAS